MALELFWSWAKEAELNPHELLLAQNNSAETALCLAERQNYREIVQKILDWFKEAKLNPNKSKWHQAAIFDWLRELWRRLRIWK